MRGPKNRPHPPEELSEFGFGFLKGGDKITNAFTYEGMPAARRTEPDRIAKRVTRGGKRPHQQRLIVRPPLGRRVDDGANESTNCVCKIQV
jgi:hypothetical protein